MDNKTSLREPSNVQLLEHPPCITSHDLISTTKSLAKSHLDHSSLPDTALHALYDSDPSREGANLLKLQSCQSLVITPLNGHSQKVQILLGSF